ncbi:BnaC02g47040D [Brassica napus]|uniref:BnaC02g47040D protein n=1 Tax=Brassica napus TaxID=3708 RepID=A0A078IQP1_BRANA|nr:BnaC02g47040D [Brassica napus]
MLGTPTDVANVYVLTIPPNRVAMLNRAPCLHQEFSLTRMCLRQLITSLDLCLPQTGTYSDGNSTVLARCKNHLCRSVTTDIKGEQLPGPIVTCNSAFGETFYTGSCSGGSAPTNDSEIHRSDYLYKGTALHLAAQIAILDVAGYCFPSVYQCLNCWSLLTDNKSLVAGFDQKSIRWRNNTQRDAAVTHEFGNFCCSVHCGRWNHNRSYRLLSYYPIDAEILNGEAKL